jgi:hypothetical protein
VTGPVSGPLSCYVEVDGVRVADGSPGEPVHAPFVLDGLTIDWGRTTTLDQPDPATCSLDVVDPTGGQTFLSLLSVGTRLDVFTHTTVYPDPTVPTITDPSFESGGPGWATNDGTVTVVGAAGARYAQVTPWDPTRRVRVIFPPAPFVPNGTNPTAWDAVPLTLPGQSWAYGATVRVPVALAAAAAAVIHPVTFTGPWVSTSLVLDGPGGGSLAVPADGTWHPVSGVFEPPAAVWIGVCVDVYPTGPTWDQVPVGTTWDQVPAGVTWDALVQVGVDDLLVLAPAAGADRLAVVFGGRITDLEAAYDDDGARTLVQVTAQDHTAELANRDVGDEPWPTEALGTRAARIVALAGQDTDLTVDPGPAAVAVSLTDVDRKSAMDLLDELATTVDGVLWSAVHLATGQYLHLEDTTTRPALMVLAYDPGTGYVTIQTATSVPGALTLSACDVLLDPVRWVQDVADVSSRVAVRWLEQTTDAGTPVTAEHTLTLDDPALIAALGVRRIAVSTVLTTSTDAAALAARVLARTGDHGWRIGGLTWATGTDDLAPDDVDRAFLLLDGTTRLGVPILLTDLPDWSPSGEDTVALFLEGGRYTFTGGHWHLDLIVSRAVAQGASTLTWDDLDPTWTWNQLDPTMTWDDLTGVGAGT